MSNDLRGRGLACNQGLQLPVISNDLSEIVGQPSLARNEYCYSEEDMKAVLHEQRLSEDIKLEWMGALLMSLPFCFWIFTKVSGTLHETSFLEFKTIWLTIETSVWNESIKNPENLQVSWSELKDCISLFISLLQNPSCEGIIWNWVN